MPPYTLPFEKPILELENKLRDLTQFSETQKIDVSGEIERMQKRITDTRRKIYNELTPWQKVQVARHPLRPYTNDYIQLMTRDWLEIHGDRNYRDDRAIIGGFATIDDERVILIGTQKGRDTKSNLECNFGCAYPEGYRKALRLMKMAAKFRLPVVVLVDTPGAYPGIESEERHIAEAIAVNLREMFTFPVPIIVTIIGEGGSGGALGIGVGDRVLVLEHAYYSVISPEGCAAILWKDRAYADRAAAALRLTSNDLIAMGFADEIVTEPLGGAHGDPAAMADTLKTAILRNLKEVQMMSDDQRLQTRYKKFRAMGRFGEGEPPSRAAARRATLTPPPAAPRGAGETLADQEPPAEN
ncbi:MAG: acetyl-CoA carboxylase carboxyltransferase subunit alpha [Kiritimatiellae bacterium]|nr:acetyl-CoA carboxylase carboxyltransferase subunit alpha [Kiritimatiellia bacterium]MCO5067447.1 acetyl-CoA carboxylase carboxyltransferase subunit alpha [Kiritimatiellia bacterium]